MTSVIKLGLLPFYTSNNFPEQANSGWQERPSPLRVTLVHCQAGPGDAHVEKTVNRVLRGDFAKTVVTFNFLLWRLPVCSEFLHLPILVERK